MLFSLVSFRIPVSHQIQRYLLSSLPAARAIQQCASWRSRSVKPSAKPTLVRTQHLPPPAETAPGLRICGRGLILPSAVMCGRGQAYAGACAQYVPKIAAGSVIEAVRPARGAAVVWSGRFEGAPHGLVLLPGDAVGVDPEEHVHAVACPFGDLWRGHSGVKPCRDGGVTEVVGAPGQQRRCFRPAESCVACLVEDRAVGAAAGADEHAAVWSGAVLLKM